MQRIIDQTKRVLAVTAIACLTAFAFTSNSSGADAGAAVAPADAAATYKSKCAGCHGANGSGQTRTGKALKLRDLRSAEVRAQSDDQLYDIVAKGKGKMPGYEKTLHAETCKALVAYCRQLK
jgi:cytochrome c6